MSDIYVARTNQKLAFARLHLDALVQAQGSTGWSKHALIESYHESVLFHLRGALHAFVREVGEHYRLACDQIDDIAGLQAQLERTGQESPELNELQQLSSQAGGWMQKLQHAYDACWQASDVRGRLPEAEQSLSEIHVVQINPDHSEDADLLSECQHWFNTLRALVERLRNSMLEW